MAVREKGWSDLGNAYFTMLMMSALDIGGWLSKKLDACAQHDDSPRDTYGWRDVVAATLAMPARKTGAVREAMTTSYSPVLMLGGLAAGVTSGFYAATGTAALLGGQGILAAAAALAAGVVTAPLVATAIGVGCSILLPMAAAATICWPTMLAKGFREAELCRQYRMNPPKVTVPEPPKHPPLTDSLDNHLSLIGLQNGRAREAFFRTLRKRFPAEFNEAAHLDAHAPVLRAPVTVKGPLKLRAPAPTPDTGQGGAP
ncbi:MAG: hypothetical protein ACAH80_04235 [Alphaproteobacteria bacterium]